MTQQEKIRACIHELADSKSFFDGYATPKGLKELRITIANYLSKKLNTEISAENLFITAGSQQSIDLLSRLLIKPNDTIISEEPTYFGAIGSFGKQKANVSTVGVDDSGIDLNGLKQVITKNDPKLIYTVPTFNNPTGISWTGDQRQEFLEIANRHNLPIIEDDPYSEFNYVGEKFKSLFELNKNDNGIYLGTFSKIISPELNVGYILANKSIIHALYEQKIFADMNTSPFVQKFVNHYLNNFDIESDIDTKRNLYKEKSVSVREQLSSEFPDIKLSNMKGGLYMSAYLPNEIETCIYDTNYFDTARQKLHRVNISKPYAEISQGLNSTLSRGRNT